VANLKNITVKQSILFEHPFSENFDDVEIRCRELIYNYNNQTLDDTIDSIDKMFVVGQIKKTIFTILEQCRVLSKSC